MGNLRPLTSELSEVARTQLNENETTRLAQIETFRTWINGEPTLNARLDDQFLIAFLRFSHWNLEEAKNRLLFYYTYKTKERELLKSRDIDEKLMEIARSGIFATLPNPVGAGGPRIHLTRMGRIDTSKFSVSDFFRFHCFRAEIEINTDDNWNIAGVVEIIDFTKIPYSLLLQFDAGLFKRMNSFLENGIPTNLVATHIVNASRETQFVLNLVRNVMKQKELLHIHSNLESLQKAIGKEYLPVEFGGQNGTLDDAVSNFVQLLTQYTQYFKEEEQYGIVDKKVLKTTQAASVKSSVTTIGPLHKLNFD